jgi:hypothetical protein
MPVQSHLANNCSCQLSRIGTPAAAVVVVLAVLGFGVICWIINSPDRSDRVNRMLLARRGDTNCLAPGTSVRSLRAARPRSIR